MKPPKNITLVNAEYAGEYKYKFTFSDKVVSVVNFKPIIFHGTLRTFLDVDKFKKMRFEKDTGDIYWGKNWDMCFHIETYYGETEVRHKRNPFKAGVESNIRIQTVKYLEGYKLKIVFTDGHTNIFDYKSIVTSGHEESKSYVNIENFKKFQIASRRTEIVWGKNEDDMMLPMEILYLQSRVNRISKKTQAKMEQFAKEFYKANGKLLK